MTATSSVSIAVPETATASIWTLGTRSSSSSRTAGSSMVGSISTTSTPGTSSGRSPRSVGHSVRRGQVAGVTDPVTSQGPPPACAARALRRELHGHDVAVAHRVVAPLEPQRAALAGARVAARGHQLVPGHDLRAHEAALDVGVDLAG